MQPAHRVWGFARAALAAADAVSADERPTVIVHITDESRCPTDYAIHGDVRVFVVDENCPHDRVYEMTRREKIERIREIIPEGCEIGSQHDERHTAIEAKIDAYLDGRKHLSVAAAPSPEDAT